MSSILKMNAGVTLPVYHRIRGYLVSKTMYTATQQICLCQKFYKETQGSVDMSSTESQDTWSLRQYTLLPSKFTNVINLKRNAGVSLPVYHTFRGYLVPKRMNTATKQICECHQLKKGMKGSVYLSTTESEDTCLLRQPTLLPSKFANVMNFKNECRGQSTCLPKNQRTLGL